MEGAPAAPVPRVAFSAALGLPRSEPGTVPFDKVLLNDGGYYDPETGNREDRQGAQLRTWVRPPSCLYRQVQLSICNCKDLYPLHALTTQLRQGESGEGRDIHTTHIFIGTDSSTGPAATAGDATGDPYRVQSSGLSGKGPVGHSQLGVLYPLSRRPSLSSHYLSS